MTRICGASWVDVIHLSISICSSIEDNRAQVMRIEGLLSKEDLELSKVLRSDNIFSEYYQALKSPFKGI